MNQRYRKCRFLCLFFLSILWASTAYPQGGMNRDSIDLLIQNEQVDSLRYKHLISAIENLKFESELDVERYFKRAKALSQELIDTELNMQLYEIAGTQFRKLKNYKEASIKFSKLRKLSEVHKNQKYKAKSVMGESLVLYDRKKIEEAKKLLIENQDLIEGSNQPSLYARSCFLLAKISRTQGQFKEALEFLDRSDMVYSEEMNVSDYLESLNLRGRVYRSLGKYDTARLTYAKVIQIAIEEKEDGSLARAYNNLGNIDQLKGDLEGALSQYVQSLKIKERIGNKRGIALAHYNIGTVKVAMKSFSGSIDNFCKSKQLALDIEYDRVVQLSELKIGNAYHEMNRLDSAVIYHLSSLKMAEASKNKNGIALCYINLGEDYTKLKEFNKAFYYLTEALRISKETGNVSYQGGALSYIANTYLEAKKYAEEENAFNLESIELNNQQIEKYLLEANKIGDETNNFEVKEASLIGLNHLYSKTNNYKANAAVLQEQLALKDSLFSKEKTQAITDWETKYETAEKEKEITKLEVAKEKSAARIRFWSIISFLLFAILGVGSYLFHQLQKVRKKLLVQNDQLTELNQTKDRFFGIIAHDIRSPIVALESVDDQMEFYLKKENPKKLLELGGLVGKTARHLNSLLDNLLNWALVQTESMPYHPEKILVADVWNEIKDLMGANAQVKNIELKAEIPDQLKIDADSASFNTVLRNLMSNAIKFSHPNSRILFTAEQKNGEVLFDVKDFGVGIPQNKVETMFTLEKKSQKGTAGEKGTGLGLILCKDLVELNKGKIFVDSVEGEGSTFSFTIPNRS